MKTTLLLFALCLLGASAAFGQAAVGGAYLSNQPVVIEFPDHPQHAMQQSLSREQSVLESSIPVSAQGQRPLWEVAPVARVTPLGDIARMLKKEHEGAKKASIVWEN